MGQQIHNTTERRFSESVTLVVKANGALSEVDGYCTYFYIYTYIYMCVPRKKTKRNQENGPILHIYAAFRYAAFSVGYRTESFDVSKYRTFDRILNFRWNIELSIEYRTFDGISNFR